jgi:DNA-binding IclR family transcriptional regulator
MWADVLPSDQPVQTMTERSTVKSARRVLEILELFAQGLRQATVMDVANALTYPQSSTTALLSTLTTLGFLRFDPTDRTYSPTLRVMLLGSWMQDELFGEGSLVATMEHLRQLTRQTIMIGLRQGIHVRFIFSLQGLESDGIYYPVGVLRPVCRSAVGKMLLSELPDAQVAKLARHANAKEPPENRVVLGELLDEIAKIRVQGWAKTVDYPLPNRATLAVALPELPGQPRMAMTIGARKTLLQARHAPFLAALRESCDRLGVGGRRPVV